VQDRALVQGGPQRPVQAVFQVKVTVPPDHVREQVTVEGGILGQHHLQVKDILGGNELIQPDRARRYLSPFTRRPRMIGVRPSVPDLLEDHVLSLDEPPEWRGR